MCFISKTIQCIIEYTGKDGVAVGRSYADAPEIDGLIYIKTNEHLSPSQIVEVKVIDADSYDLVGQV